MSNSKFKIAYEIFAVDKFSAVFDRFTAGTAASDRALRAISTAGMQLTTAGMALGGTFAFAATQSALFEREMSAVQAVSGATGAELDQLTAKAREMGRDTSFSAHEAAEGLKYLGLAGWKSSEMLAGIEPVLHAAEAGGMDLGRAADLTSDSMAGLGLKADQTGYYLDRVAQTSRNSNTEVSQLMDAFRIGGGQLSALNVPLEESAALFGIMANRGYKGAQAGRAMNAIVQNMTTGFGRAGDAMEEINVTAFDSQGNFKGLEATFREIIVATKDMTEEERNRIYAMIAGKEHIKTFMAIINGLGEEYDELKMKNINANGALKDMRDIMKDNLIGELERLWSGIKEFAISIGDALMPAIKTAVSGLNSFVESLNGMGDGAKRNIAFGGALASAFLVLNGVIISSVAGAARFATALKDLGISFGTVMKLGTSLTGVLGVVAAVGMKMYKSAADEALDATLDFGDGVSEATQSAVNSYSSLMQEVQAETDVFADGLVAMEDKIVNKLADSQQELTDVTLANVRERHRQEKEEMQEHLADMAMFDEERQAQIIDGLDNHYAEQEKMVQDNHDRILEIYREASDEKREITQQEAEEIEALRQEQSEAAIEAMAQDYQEQIAIMEAFAERESEITAERAAMAVEQSLERKEALINAAEEEYEEQIAAAIRLSEELGLISDEEAEAIMERAEEQKDARVQAAEEAHEELLASAQDAAGEHIDLIDWETGEILSAWDIFKNDLVDKFNTVREALSPLEAAFDTLKVVMKAVGDIAESMFDGVIDGLKPLADTAELVFTSIKEDVEKLTKEMEDLWDEHGDTIKEAWETIQKIIKVTMTIITGIVTSSLTVLGVLFTIAFGGIIDIVSGGMKMIEGIIKIVTSVMEGDWSGAWEGMKTLVAGAVQFIWGIVQTVLGGGLMKTMAKIGAKILKGTIKAVKGAIKAVVSGIGNMLTSATKFFMGLPKAIIKEGPKAVKEVVKVVKKTITSVKDKVSDMKNAAKDLIGGLIKGMVDKGKEAIDKAKELAKKIGDTIKNAFRIKSPSRLMMEYGAYVSEGLAIGISKKTNHAVKSADELAQSVIGKYKEYNTKYSELLESQQWAIEDAEKSHQDNLKQLREKAQKEGYMNTVRYQKEYDRAVKEHQRNLRDTQEKHLEERNKMFEELNKEMFDEMDRYIERGKESGRISLADEIKFWNDIRREAVFGSKAYESALERHQDRVAELRSEMEKTNEDYSKRMLDIDKKLLDDTQKLQDDYEKQFQDRVDSIANFKGLFDSWEFEALDEGDILDGMRSQVDGIKMYMRTMDELEGRISNTALMEELRKLGVGSVNEINALNRLTDKELDEYVRLFEEKRVLGETQAAKEFREEAKELRHAIWDLEDAAREEMHNLQYEWEMAIRNMVYSSKKEFDSMSKVGSDAITGLRDGMMSMQSSVNDAAENIANGVSYIIKDTLKIKSPSRVLFKLGEHTGEGFGKGIEDTASLVKKATKKLAVSAIPEIEEFDIRYNIETEGDMLDLESIENNLKMELDDDELVNALQGLERSLSGGMSGGNNVINVEIDGRTVATMSHVEDFFKEIEQEIRKRR